MKRLPRRAWPALALALVTSCAPAGWASTAPAATPLTPFATTVPELTGTPSVGETLRCSTGSWTNDPAGFTYAWLRDGVPIAGQAAADYVVQPTDEGHSIACEVTAEVLGDEYEIVGLPSESYRVLFSPTAGVNYLPQYFSGESSVTEATPVAVTAPAAVPGIDASLAVGGGISGRVTDESGAPLANVEVGIGFLNHRRTDANGEYTFSGLPAGSYTVFFNPEALGQVCHGAVCEEYEAQYYDDEPAGGAADHVTVTPPGTASGIDAVLKSRSIPSGSIIGTVTGPTGTLPGVQACARVFESFPWYCATTDASGHYTIASLPEGDEYVVGFFPAEGENYIGRYYGETLEELKATKLAVIAGEATAADETLEEGGEITGQVTEKSGTTPLAGIEVCIANNGLLLRAHCVSTDKQGEYVVAGLPTGEYDITFDPGHSNYEHYFEPTVDEAYLPYLKPSLAVTAKSPNPPLDVALEEGGRIAGRVTTTGGTPFVGGKVCASEPASPPLYSGRKCAFANADGDYAIVGLAAGGGYEVFFHGEQCGEAGCVQSYLGQAHAQPVSVEVAKPTPGIDAELAEGGKITGAITAVGGGALAGAIEACTRPTGSNAAYDEHELRKCVPAHAAAGSASARSNPLTIATSQPRGGPKVPPRRPFKLVRKRFDAKAQRLDLFFRVFYQGSLRWRLRFTSAGGAKRNGKAHREASGSFGSGSRRVSPGRIEIKVRPSPKARKALRAGRLLRVKGKVSFRLTSGNGLETVQLNARVRQAKRRKGGHKRR